MSQSNNILTWLHIKMTCGIKKKKTEYNQNPDLLYQNLQPMGPRNLHTLKLPK